MRWLFDMLRYFVTVPLGYLNFITDFHFLNFISSVCTCRVEFQTRKAAHVLTTLARAFCKGWRWFLLCSRDGCIVAEVSWWLLFKRVGCVPGSRLSLDWRHWDGVSRKPHHKLPAVHPHLCPVSSLFHPLSYDGVELVDEEDHQDQCYYKTGPGDALIETFRMKVNQVNLHPVTFNWGCLWGRVFIAMESPTHLLYWFFCEIKDIP